MGKPTEVLLDVTPADSEGPTATVHVAWVTMVRGKVHDGCNPIPQQNLTEDYDADELPKDFCLPAHCFEPTDNPSIHVNTTPEPPLI